MSTSAASTGRLRRGWEYYRQYTKRRTGIHAAATAALTGFGLLAYFEQWFVAVAIASYLLPPIYLYLSGDDLADSDGRSAAHADHANHGARRSAVRDADADADGIDADFDADGTDADADFDGIDGDADADGADADADGADADADADGTDDDADADGTDTDTDGVDTDTDSDGADMDTDTDGVDTDSDG